MRRVQVGAVERESGAGMIKRADVFPPLRHVAGVAGQVRLWIDLMRVGVTGVAGTGGKVILTARVVRGARYVSR